MKYEVIIGLEVHIELETESKMFCSCSADYFTAKPNTHTCPVCLGLPGAIPTANKKAIRYAQKFGLALGCSALRSSKFDRKNYFYPDLAKGFQISQYDLPFSQKGKVDIKCGEVVKKIGITRVHLEEDTGKLTHANIKGKQVTLIDFNRSGVPLLEIVSEPDLRSAQEAKSYAQKLQQLARYLEVSRADMEKGSMRVEPNISLRKHGHKKLPDYKVELKNINSFRFAEKAINYEISRQQKALENGKQLIQETRGWDEKNNRTVSQRSKEEAHDYRYFPEPDIPPLRFKKQYIANIIKSIPELPDIKKARFIRQYRLSAYDSQVLTADNKLADFFEETVKVYKKGDPKRASNWITGELLRRLKEKGKAINDLNILPANIAELLYFIDSGKLTKNTAKEVFVKMIETDKSLRQIISGLGLKPLSADNLTKVIEKVIKENQKAVTDFKKGKEASVGFLIGQVQKETKGAVSPGDSRELLLKKLR